MLRALIALPDAPLDSTRVGRILAFHFDLHPADAIARVRYGGGIIIEK